MYSSSSMASCRRRRGGVYVRTRSAHGGAMGERFSYFNFFSFLRNPTTIDVINKCGTTNIFYYSHLVPSPFDTAYTLKRYRIISFILSQYF